MSDISTILIVEDDHQTRLALKDCLEADGDRVIMAQNGFEAWQILQTMPPPSLIILDLNMPVMNGDEFLRKLQSEPTFSFIPVIQISGDSTHKRARALYSLAKPFHPDDLRILVDVCTGRALT